MEKLFELHPKAAAFLREHGIVCFVYGEPVWGTLYELIERKELDLE